MWHLGGGHSAGAAKLMAADAKWMGGRREMVGRRPQNCWAATTINGVVAANLDGGCQNDVIYLYNCIDDVIDDDCVSFA